MGQVNWPFTKGRDLSIVRAEGTCLFTEDGQRILDAAGGAIVVNVGHGRERVAQKVMEATLDYSYVVPPWITPSRAAMSKALVDDWLPPSLPRIHCTSGGSEANESAMKIALQYHAARGESTRTKIVSRALSYHGTTMKTTAVSGHAARKKGLTQALEAQVTVPTPYPLRCPLGPHHPDTGAYYAGLLEETILEHGPETIAAFLAEPITGSSGGAIVPPDDYWPMVREICDRYGILLILDEVMTGFGRTGKPFGYQHWPIEPDLLVGGKGLAGGYAPLGGVFATEHIGLTLDNAGMNVMFHTFGAHPAACAAAAEVLTILVEEDLVARAETQGNKLLKGLNDTFSNHPHVAEVRGRGLLTAIEIVEDRATLEPFAADKNITSRVVAAGLENGIFFYGGGTGDVRDIVCMGPPFIITDSEIEQICDVLHRCVNQAV
jgi:adenosylmethionine-8-amino-7-oxononanoate aminotransferase